jgi:2'-5' RNA ligase
MNRSVLSAEPFSLSLCGLGVFPNMNRPRVLWVGLKDPEEQLETLYKKIEKEMACIGFAEESRSFSSHLTLARIKSPKGRNRLKHKVESSEPVESDSFEISSVILFQSQLTPRGSIYTALEEFKLTGPGSRH